MFDIGFWELAIIGVVALIVIGPERLPAVARTVGVWVGKARRFISSVQNDIRNEMNQSEQLAKLLEEQSKLKEMHEIIEQTVDDTRKTVAVGYNQDQAPRHQPKPFHDDSDDEPLSMTEEPLDKAQNPQEPDTASESSAQTAEGVNEKHQ